MLKKMVKDLGESHRQRMKTTFASMKFRNYKLWFFGQMFSLFGTWMESTAEAFLIYQLTGSAAYLGLVAFAAGVPAWLLMLYGGVVSDRFDKKKILIVTQTSMMILSFILAYLTFSGLVRPWHILLLAFISGIINAFDSPARQSFVLEMVDRDHLTNAIALNGMMFNTSIIVGPALGGLIYAAFGPAWCFTINAVSFLAIIVNLTLMNTKFIAKVTTKKVSVFEDLKDGIRYARSNPTILGILCFMLTFGLFASSFGTLIPAWAVQILHGDSRTSGFMTAFRGLGALAMAFLIASMGNPKRKGKIFTAGTFLFPLFIGILAFITNEPLTFFVLIFIGASNIMISNVSNMILQTTVNDQYRGRVMALLSLVFFGVMPIGSLLIGAIATAAGEQTAILIMSGLSLAAAFVIWRVFPAIQKSA